MVKQIGFHWTAPPCILNKVWNVRGVRGCISKAICQDKVCISIERYVAGDLPMNDLEKMSALLYASAATRSRF